MRLVQWEYLIPVAFFLSNYLLHFVHPVFLHVRRGERNLAAYLVIHRLSLKFRSSGPALLPPTREEYPLSRLCRSFRILTQIAIEERSPFFDPQRRQPRDSP